MFKWLLEMFFAGIGVYASVAQIVGNDIKNPFNIFTIIALVGFFIYEIKDGASKGQLSIK